ncbi:putative F-box protein At3g25750 [Sesamum indicum]|uniref:F-box protein At3g25750 n=1 Tax=Sesamum indicum TaxID=4182 RepID=A0A6I9SJT3_SESIN|nr:putative F-box protein At3g25750 [Sesamum indicum]
MAQKTAKKIRNQPSSGEQTTSNPKLWPNLPRQLIGMLAREPNLMQNITSFGGVIKSWRSASRQCYSNDGKARARWPQLVEITGKKCTEHQKSGRQHSIEISFHEECPYSYYKRRSYKKWYPGIYFKGHSHGELVVMGENTADLCLWEPARGCYRYLPAWDRNLAFKMCTLSSPTDDRKGCNVLVLTGACSPAFAFFRWGKHEMSWTIQNCTVKEPYAPSQNMQFINAIGFHGKFYALSLQGSLAVIEDTDSCFRITAIGGSRAVPSKVSRQFREYLVESCGEILLVFLISRKSIDHVEDVEVFRLDIPKLSWVEVENLGDRTLFLEDECCMGVTASKVGCKKNCIYFSHHRVYDQWWVFNMESGNISPAFETNAKIQESLIWNEPILDLE